jgi:hypothetical protein
MAEASVGSGWVERKPLGCGWGAGCKPGAAGAGEIREVAVAVLLTPLDEGSEDAL